MSLQDFIDVAENQVGYEESSDGTTTYGEWYGLPTGAWCAMFVSWCANEAGIMTTSDTKDCPYVRKASTVRALREFYGNNNRDLAPSMNTSSANYPQPGDLAVIDNSAGQYAHVGIIVEVNGNQVTTVEGNLGGKVKRVTYTDLYRKNYGTISMILSNHVHY